METILPVGGIAVQLRPGGCMCVNYVMPNSQSFLFQKISRHNCPMPKFKPIALSTISDFLVLLVLSI